ncbi:MAG: restriction endonuclease [Agriterribacter sp.]
MNGWKHYEYVVGKIYGELAPYADVRVNDKILGRDSGIERQIDVSVRSKIANHELLMIIQVKDYKRPADVNIVGEFNSVIKDVGAQKGIICCKAGFTKAAISQAKNLNIDLLSVHDTVSDDIVMNYKFPTLKESVVVQWKEFQFSMEEIMDDTLIEKTIMSEDLARRFFSLPLIAKLSKKTTLIAQFYEQWDSLQGCVEKKKYTFHFEGGTFEYDGKKFQISDFAMEAEFERHLSYKKMRLFDKKILKTHIPESEKNVIIFAPEKIPFLNDESWESIEDITILDSSMPTLHLEIFDFKFHTFRRFNVVSGLDFSKRRLYDKNFFSNELPPS